MHDANLKKKKKLFKKSSKIVDDIVKKDLYVKDQSTKG